MNSTLGFDAELTIDCWYTEINDCHKYNLNETMYLILEMLTEEDYE